MWSAFFHAALLSMLPAHAEPAEEERGRDPVLASVHRGLLYGFANRRLEVNGLDLAQLTRVPLLPNLPNAPPDKEKIVLSFESGDADSKAFQPVRWRISSDALWECSKGVFLAGVGRWKLSDLDLYDENDATTMRRFKERYGGLLNETELSTYFHDWAFDDLRIHAERMRQLPALRNLKGVEDIKEINRELAFYDYLPTGPTSGRLFLLEGKKCKVWSVLAEFRKILKVREWSLTYSDNPLAVIDLGFTEPFTVFSEKGAFFFLTRSCKLYSAAKDADGTWQVKKLWSDPARPIRAVVTDTAANTSYAFTEAKADKDGKKAKDVYFAFDTKPAPVEFDRAKLKAFKLDPPLDTLRAYTELLIDAKKIDPRPPVK